MDKTDLTQLIADWKLPKEGRLLDRIEQMIRPAIMGGYFRTDFTAIVCGLQYHLGGETDTSELAELASISPDDYVLDVCCYLGGPAIQLAESFRCRVIGIDIDEHLVTTAKRITELADLSDLVEYHEADAACLPFDDEQFSVVWSQCSLAHNENWLYEFDRVLMKGGRMAFTFEIRGVKTDASSPIKWGLNDAVNLLGTLGYTVEHAQDITERDIEIGWSYLDRTLKSKEQEFIAALGRDWVNQAHEDFANEIRRMRAGKWGNGRIIARKK